MCVSVYAYTYMERKAPTKQQPTMFLLAILVACRALAAAAGSTDRVPPCDPSRMVALTARTSAVVGGLTDVFVRSWPDLKLQPKLAYRKACGDAEDDNGPPCVGHTRIEQIAESETHMCIQVDGRMSCVMTIALDTDAAGTVYSRFESDWLGEIAAAGRLSHFCSGDFFSCGVSAADQQLKCWGARTACASGVCSPPAADGGFSRVACGTFHACALTALHGHVLCWGSDDDGQGQPPAGEFSAVSAGARHTCALGTHGHVLCWGSNQGVGEFEGK